ncbi:MAG: hypothetical protein J5637_00235 [Prevotella sp.]|nr:hypothetical protein [Prevotella sp.]
MKQLFLILFLFSIGMASHAEEASLDSVSYVFGDKVIRSFVENKDSMLPAFEYNKDNLAELIRGLEDNLVYMKYSQDSIKKLSFNLGVMQAVFFSDGIQSQKDVIPFDCILAGLTKVVHHELTLPQDTIKINAFIKGLPQDMDPVDLPEEDRCRFFTYFGIMKGLQPGLQGYIHEATGKTEKEAPADYEAYVAGFAHMVKMLSFDGQQESELRPYDYGTFIGSSVLLEQFSFQFTKADFLEGCRAAAGLIERKITVEESDRIFSKAFPESEAPTIIQEVK